MVEPNEEILDCRMPGGGSMYYLRRVDRKGMYKYIWIYNYSIN